MAESIGEQSVDLTFKRCFQKVWTEWRKRLNVMVTAKGGKLICPTADDLKFTMSSRECVATPKWPICFQSLPQKGNTTGGGHKVFIFVDGSFSFARESGPTTSSKLVSATSNIAFFRPNSASTQTALDLVDAYHFDHFFEDPKTSIPHPIFHAQRNIRLDDAFPKFTESLNSQTDNTTVVSDLTQQEKNNLFGFKTFRLPTPQLDLFSLSAIVAADHLVGKCAHDSEEYIRFKSFLAHIGEQSASMAQVFHRPAIRAVAADSSNRFVWQWYSRH